MKILIVTGGNVDVLWAKQYILSEGFDYIIAADSGLVHVNEIGIKPDVILGDYDSVNQEVLNDYKLSNEVITYPREKDYTDTHIAIMTAIEKGADYICIIGAIGTRMDHTFTNISNMKVALDAGVECYIVDEHNRIQVADDNKQSIFINKDSQYGDYVSIVPLSDKVNITLSGFKYNLESFDLKQGLSICQSNEIIENVANILINKGFIAVFETLD